MSIRSWDRVWIQSQYITEPKRFSWTRWVDNRKESTQQPYKDIQRQWCNVSWKHIRKFGNLHWSHSTRKWTNCFIYPTFMYVCYPPYFQLTDILSICIYRLSFFPDQQNMMNKQKQTYQKSTYQIIVICTSTHDECIKCNSGLKRIRTNKTKQSSSTLL